MNLEKGSWYPVLYGWPYGIPSMLASDNTGDVYISMLGYPIQYYQRKIPMRKFRIRFPV